MSNKVGDFFRYRIRYILILGVFAGVALVAYQVYKSWIDRNQHMWEAGVNKDIAEYLVLADQRLLQARTELEMACKNWGSLGNVSINSPECDDAKKQYQSALALKEKSVRGEVETFSQPRRVQQYYNGTYASSQTKPFPFYLFLGIGTLLLSGVLLVFYPRLSDFFKKNRGSAESDALFPKKKGGFL